MPDPIQYTMPMYQQMMMDPRLVSAGKMGQGASPYSAQSGRRTGQFADMAGPMLQQQLSRMYLHGGYNPQMLAPGLNQASILTQLGFQARGKR